MIEGGFTVTVDVNNATCTTLDLGSTISGHGAGAIAFNSGSQLTVSGTLYIGVKATDSLRTGSINMANGGMLISTCLLCNNLGTWTPGAGTVQLTYENTLPTNGITSFNNLTISSGTTTLGTSIAVSGTLTQSGGNIAVGSKTLTVNGSHVAGTGTVSGAGGYTLASGGTLAIGHANGIDGNITVSGTKTLSTGANYLYNGTAAQAAGALLPATVNSLTINNTAGAVTLSQVTTVTRGVTLASGAKVGLPSGTSTAATLSIAGVNQASGTWGNTGSGAANIDSAHFAGSGVLKVGSGSTSSTALASSLNPSTYGSPVTFTATVTGTGPTPTGTVTLKEGSTTLGAGTLDSSGVATFVISTLPVAGSPHSITAVYGGDGNFGSSSGTVTQGVLPRVSGGLASGSLSGYKGSAIKVVFVAKDSAGAALETNEVHLATTNGGSSFTYAIGVPPNTATLSLKPGFYLRKRFSVPPAIATANEVTIEITWTFLGGDADGNNQVDGNDYAWIRALWDQPSNPQPQYDINGDGRTNADDFPDLNGDGVIDALDYAILKDGWYQQGDPQ